MFKDGSATMLARVVGANGAVIVQADIASAAYSVTLLDDDDPDTGTAIEGHANVAVDVAGLIHDNLQTDDLWDVDAIGYNFKHVLDVAENQAFATAGRNSRIVFRLTPTSGQVLLVRFKVCAI